LQPGQLQRGTELPYLQRPVSLSLELYHNGYSRQYCFLEFLHPHDPGKQVHHRDPGAVLYNTNGDANDWMYGDQSGKPKVYAYTPETGNDLDGFWPFPDRIIPLCEENMYQNLMMAHLALEYDEATNSSSAIVSERQGYFKFNFERYGLVGNASNSVSIEPMDTTQIIQVGPAKNFSYPAQFVIKTDSIAYTLAPDMNIGTSFRYILKCNNGLYTSATQ